MANIHFFKLVRVVLMFSAILKNCFVNSCNCEDNGYWNCTNGNHAAPEKTDSCLTTANYSNNYIEDFDARILYNYINIDLSHNRIKNLQINTPFENAKFLNVSYNKIEAIKIQYMDNLEVLDLSHNNNNITKAIKLISLPNNITSIYISNTAIKSLESVSKCENLKHFIASNCELNSESMYTQPGKKNVFSKMKNLETLDLSSNRIEEISQEMLMGLISIIQLDLSNNKIRTIDLPLEHLSSLQRLDLSTNVLDAVPNFQQGQSLTKVDLSYNSITNLDVQVLKNIIRNGTVSCEIDIRGLNKAVGKEFLQNIKTITHDVENHTNCSCANVSFGSTNLNLCVKDASGPCWVEEAMRSTTHTPSTSTTQSTTEVTTNTSVTNITETTPESKAMNDSSPMSHASYFLQSLGPAKLSFLAILLFTLVILIIINCIVGDPVVDDNWWEEIHPGDRLVT